MALRTPNATGEVGTYNASGTITLPGTASLPGMRTFSASATAGKLAVADHIGVKITRSGYPAIWSVQIAEYASGSLTLLEEEDSAGTLSDGDSVDVFASLTDTMLASASLSYALPTQTGPDWWNIEENWGTPYATWDSATGEYTITDTQFCLSMVTTGANANWGIGLNPTEITLELWLPSDGSSMDWEYANLQSAGRDTCSSADAAGEQVGIGISGGQWVTISVDESWGLDSMSDLKRIWIGALYGTGTYKVRNINVTPRP